MIVRDPDPSVIRRMPSEAFPRLSLARGSVQGSG